MSLFVDTSVWYAAADSSDASNARAKTILAAGEPLVTSDHLLVETWTLLRYRIRRQAAERFWEGLRSGVAAVEPVGAADLVRSRLGNRSLLSLPEFFRRRPNELRCDAPPRHRSRCFLRQRFRHLPLWAGPPSRVHHSPMRYGAIVGSGGRLGLDHALHGKDFARGGRSGLRYVAGGFSAFSTPLSQEIIFSL